MKNFKIFIVSLFVVAVGVVVVIPAASVGALDPLSNVCEANSGSQLCDTNEPTADDIVKTVINTLLFVVGLLAVIMMIVGGIFYTSSGGDSGKVTKAKNTIMYSVVGLIIAFLAYAIINWVLEILPQ